jgi:hypothetical protein
MMSFICSCKNKNQPNAIDPKGTSHHGGGCLEGLALMIRKSRMVLAAPGPLLTPSSSSSLTQPRLAGRPRPPQAESGHGRPGRAPSHHSRPTSTPATARLRRGLPPTKGHPLSHPPTKRQPVIVGAVERGGRGTTARRTTTRAAPGRSHPRTYAR